MAFDYDKLGKLFSGTSMFDSRKTWRRAGFDVLDPAKDTECMVAGHPSVQGVLFKKYTNAVSQREQIANYEARIEGSKRLASFIERKGLRNIVVPKKHLLTLPERVLVVERIDIVGRDASERRYHDINEMILRDLLLVLVEFKGLDSNSKNVQFTKDGKIAFIDLENWNRPDRKSVRLKSISSYLSKDRRKRAYKILEELE